MEKTEGKKSRLEEKYLSEVSDQLKKEYRIKNQLGVPRITKVVINSGIGEVSKNKEMIGVISSELAKICGQRPSVQKARISVASFGVREGMPVGLKVTLRGRRMYDFLDKLISITLPRLRDFRGISAKSSKTSVSCVVRMSIAPTSINSGS